MLLVKIVEVLFLKFLSVELKSFFPRHSFYAAIANNISLLFRQQKPFKCIRAGRLFKDRLTWTLICSYALYF